MRHFVAISLVATSVIAGAAAAAGNIVNGGGNVTKFPEGMFGVWMPKKGVTPKSTLGPLAYQLLGFHLGGFSALRDKRTGDVFFTLLMGQIFRVSGNQMQYCFGAGVLLEQSPFSVHETNENDVTFCWRTGLRGMPTHKTGCSGCDCAKIFINLTDSNTLTFQFWMSPPVIHADFILTRSGKEPSFEKAILTTMLFPYQQCKFVDHYGPNLPGEPDLRNKTDSRRFKKLPGGCGQSPNLAAMKNTDLALIVAKTADYVESNKGQCHQLNGINHLLNSVALPGQKTNVPDVKLQFVPPSGDCDPCDVSYSVSANIKEDEYIALGFKGQSWEHEFPYPPDKISRPCYFGMCVDSYDNFTTDRIALGYASSSLGGCVREMTMKNIIGAPTDADYKIMSKTSVQRAGDRTILRFTVSQHWPKKRFTPMPDGFFRVMWAIGKVSGGNGCAADINYHGANRGLAPIDWILALGSLPCKYNPSEMGDSSTDVVFT